MRIHQTLKLLISLSLFVSCNQNSSNIERINVTPEIISNDLYIQRNCNLIRTKNHLYLGDIRAGEQFIKIYNSDGSFQTGIGKIGNGPEEFTTPDIIPYKDDDILVWNRYGRFNSAISQKTSDGIGLKPISLPFVNENTASLQTDLDGNFITYNPTGKNIITLYSKDGEEIVSAGKLPYPQNISNINESYSGRIIYNPYNNTLLLALNMLPYAAVYKIEKNKITLLKEKELIKAEYLISDNTINIQEPGKDCFTEFCLTQDYIVSVLNDPDYQGSDHSQTSPKRNTVGVYDYNLNLVKIVNINMPRLRLAALGKDNSFYSIVQNPEYSIVKVDL